MAGPSPCRKTSAASICNYLSMPEDLPRTCRERCVGLLRRVSECAGCEAGSVRASRWMAVSKTPKEVCKNELLTA